VVVWHEQCSRQSKTIQLRRKAFSLNCSMGHDGGSLDIDMNMGMGIHAYGIYAQTWEYGCMGISCWVHLGYQCICMGPF
jgi:hypothetical protein